MVISGKEGQDSPSAPGKPELGLNCLNSSSGCGTGGNRAWVFSVALGMNVESILGAVYGGDLVLSEGCWGPQGGHRLEVLCSLSPLPCRERFPGFAFWSRLLGLVFGCLPVPVPR